MVVIYQKTKEEEIKELINSDVLTKGELLRPQLYKIEEKNKPLLKKRKKQLNKMKLKKTRFADDKLNPVFVDFLNKYEDRIKEFQSDAEQKISVNDVLSGLARIYEKVRTAVEYKGENVIRRNAIERILKRLIWENKNFRPGSNYEDISLSLMKELIWAKYLPNNFFPESKLTVLQNIIEKYIFIIERLETLPEFQTAGKIKSWLISIASSEIEDTIDPSNRELFINFMKDWFFQNYVWNDTEINEIDKDLQVYIAIHKSFTKSDDPIVRYHLLKRLIPNWDRIDENDLRLFVKDFHSYFEKIEEQLNFPARFKLYRKISSFSPAFEILRQLIRSYESDLTKFKNEPKKIQRDIVNICQDNYKSINKRVKTGILRSIIYVFITKVVFAILIEVPYEIIRFGEMRYLPLTINITFPPLMMFLVGLSIKTPGEANTEILNQKISNIIYENKNRVRSHFSLSSKSKSKFYYMFSLLYSSLFIGAFYFISKLLLSLNFTVFGIIIFFFFLSLILLFAFRIKYQANFLKVENEKENIFSHIFSYLTLPFVNLGFYLSRGLSQINFFTVLLDFLIEAPFKNTIELFEDWLSYMRERRKDVIELPE